MIEELKELEQEAMDNLDPDTYESIVSNVLSQEDQKVYQSGYIDGLQTAIRMLHEREIADNNDYSISMDEIFDDLYDDNGDEITN